MKFVAISDTHGRHNSLVLPEGDVLLHAGDISRKGDKAEIREFMGWFKRQPFKYKVMIAGNHDFFFEKYSVYDVQAEIPDEVIYLNDSGCEIEGIRIWGSPIQPWFFDWAFNRKRGEEIRKHWALIPENTDILITHGPPYGILDKVVRDNSPVGCRDLLKKVQEIQPKY
ncbi:MAG: metallophosphatase domain-containing protein, partial [Bacteroidia bacterium]